MEWNDGLLGGRYLEVVMGTSGNLTDGLCNILKGRYGGNSRYTMMVVVAVGSKRKRDDIMEADVRPTYV